MEPGKKISFGFSKSSKKVPVIQNKPPEDKKVELVECFEDQSIKIKDAVEVVDKPLVIPIRDNQRNLLDRVKRARLKNETKSNEAELDDKRADSELTLDELAARELIKDAKKQLSERETVNTNKVQYLPLKEEELSLDGEKEPTLEDYDAVPISDFGLAMLRGMGWKEGMGVGKNPVKAKNAAAAPELRPKGLGLGASKMVKSEASKQTACDEDGKTLILKRGCFAKIIAGNHKGSYCEVQGLDDEACRVIVRTSLKGEVLTLNEFLVVPVTKEEYAKMSKVLNTATYEEYKYGEMKEPIKEIKTEKEDHYSRRHSEKKEIKTEKKDHYSKRHSEKREIKTEKKDHYSRRHSEKRDEKREHRKEKR